MALCCGPKSDCSSTGYTAQRGGKLGASAGEQEYLLLIVHVTMRACHPTIRAPPIRLSQPSPLQWRVCDDRSRMHSRLQSVGEPVAHDPGGTPAPASMQLQSSERQRPHCGGTNQHAPTQTPCVSRAVLSVVLGAWSVGFLGWADWVDRR